MPGTFSVQFQSIYIFLAVQTDDMKHPKAAVDTKRRKHLTLAFITILLSLLVILILCSAKGSARTIYVDDDAPVGGDGSGEAPFRSIQHAVSSSEDGDVVRVFAGYYEEHVTVASVIELVGNGSDVTIIDGGGEGSVVTITGHGVEMSGFGVTGSGHKVSDYLTFAGIKVLSSYAKIFDNHCFQNPSCGIRLEGVTGTNLTGNNCSDSGAGIRLTRSNETLITGNICWNNSDGIYINDWCYNTHVENNNFSGNRDDGIYLSSRDFAGEGPVDYSFLVENTCFGNRGNGILLSSSNNNRIVSNICSGNGGDGIRLFQSNFNHVTWNRCDGNDGNGISVDINSRWKEDSKLDFNVINHNSCNFNMRHGIMLEDPHSPRLEDNQLEGNGFFITGNLESWLACSIDTSNQVNGRPVYLYKYWKDTWITVDPGQLILVNCHNLSIRDLDCSGGSAGIVVAYSSGLKIEDNDCSNSSVCGIYIIESEETTISGNDCSGGAGDGIYLDSCSSCVVVGNNCSGNSNGIYFYDSEDSHIENNNCSFCEQSGMVLDMSSQRNRLIGNNCSGCHDGMIIQDTSRSNIITENHCSNNAGNGVFIGDSTGQLLENNSFSGNLGNGILIYEKVSDSQRIYHNTISGNGIGINVSSHYSGYSGYVREMKVHNNSIKGNHQFGIFIPKHYTSATGNWWGDDSGPYHPRLNPSGTGDAVSDFVLVDPWTGQAEPENRTYHVSASAPAGGNGSKAHPFKEIQEAITFAGNGDVILVASGTYQENLVITKPLTLQGEGRETTIIDSRTLGGDGIWILANRSRVQGFHLMYSGGGSGHAGIRVQADHCQVQDNLITDCYHGISVRYSRNVTIRKNTVYDSQGSGGHFYSCTRVDISHNEFLSNLEGIIVSTCSFVTIDGNNCSNNYGNGISVTRDNSSITNNICLDNGITGIYVQGTDHVVTGNNCSWNEKGSGISLSCYEEDVAERSNSIISNNTCLGNRWGIRAGDISYSVLSGNNCSLNEEGIYLQEESDATWFTHNLITGNTCFGNSEKGIYFRMGGNAYPTLYGENDFHDNNVSGNKNGFYMEAGNGLVRNNTILDNNNTGLTLRGRNYTISGNTISGNAVGIDTRSSSSTNETEIRENNIYGNRDFGLLFEFNYGDEAINISSNFWGHPTGPYHEELNPGGRGDNISGLVSLEEWLEEPVGDLVLVFPDEEEEDESTDIDGPLLLASGLVCLLASLSLAFAYYEPLQFNALRLLLPLYTRLSEEQIEKDIKQQNVRGRIYQYVKDNPGVNFSAVRSEVNIGTGTTVYHLSVLQREGYLRSTTSGNHKLFWMKADFPGLSEAALTDIQRTILDTLEAGGAMFRSELQEKTAIPMTTLHSNLNVLEKAGLLRQEKRDGKNFCSLVEEPGLISP